MAEDSPVQPADSGPSSSPSMIYVLGNSHSGSTLLGFLLAAHPAIINLGELKTRSWLKDRICSCGHPVADCSFYGTHYSTFNALKKVALSDIREAGPARYFFKKKIILDQETSAHVKAFHTHIVDRVRDVLPDAKYIVDTSKSVWLLNAWLNILPRDQIKIIYLKRHTKAILASFLKRGEPFLKSLICIRTNERMIKKYLAANRLAFLEVDYNKFYADYATEAKHLSAFLGDELPTENITPVHHHAISGNRKTRDSFTNQITAFRKDDEWERVLSPLQKRVLKIIS